jgi:hypothetical protein
MYAYIHETGLGFFARVCALRERPRISSDPPPPLPFVDRFMPVPSASNTVPLY